MISFSNYTLINTRKNNDISLYLGLFEKSPTVLREAIVTTPYSAYIALFIFLEFCMVGDGVENRGSMKC